LAVEKGYRILEIHEVYEFQVTQYNPETGEGGLFVDYINTFLKLKQRRVVKLAGFKLRKTKFATLRCFGKVKESV
jgi:hypothetical protein